MTKEHVLVTGGGSGIGRSIAIEMAKQGKNVTILGRTTSKLETVFSEIVKQGGGVQFFSCDVQNKTEINDCFDKAVAKFGKLRSVVANAGIGGPNEAGAADRFDQLIQTNVMGTYYSFRAAERHLVDDIKPKQLIAISSCLARFGVPGYTGYCASKAAILGLVRALALEVADKNIQVNAICPGWVNTEMAREGIEEMAKGMGVSFEQAHQIAMKAVPLGRMSEPEEIATMVSWLIENGQSMTGQGIDINAGSWMG